MHRLLADSLFKLPVEIPFAVQEAVCRQTIELGTDTPYVHDGVPEFIWKGFTYRRVNRAAAPADLITEFQKQKRSIDFGLRHRTDLPWEWVDSPTTSFVQGIANKLSVYIKELARIQVLLLKPDHIVRPHSDKVNGQAYNEGVYRAFDSSVFKDTDFHSRNQFLTVKVPLTMNAGDNGRPYLFINSKKLPYDVGASAFCIDEYQIEHGVDSSKHWRGVLCFDAVLNLENIQRDKIQLNWSHNENL